MGTFVAHLVATIFSPVAEHHIGEDAGTTLIQSGTGVRPPGGGNWQVLVACANGSRPLSAPFALICGEDSMVHSPDWWY